MCRVVLRAEVFQYLIDTRATGCITQLLSPYEIFANDCNTFQILLK
jgi:hypothetical protein